jgi:hypothetical protein
MINLIDSSVNKFWNTSEAGNDMAAAGQMQEPSIVDHDTVYYI